MNFSLYPPPREIRDEDLFDVVKDDFALFVFE